MNTPEQSYRTLILSQGQETVVDAGDYEWLSQWKWYAHWNRRKRGYYARRTDNAAGRSFDMHRELLVLGRGDKRLGDHWDGDTLNNRRSNLRITDHKGNCENRKRRSKSSPPSDFQQKGCP